MISHRNFNFKLSPTYRRAPLIVRECLKDLIASCADHKVTFITAPAGYGKTIVMTQWYEALRNSGRASAWLTLEKSDSDRIAFISSMLTALRTVNAGLGGYTKQLLQAQIEPDLDEILDYLCGDFCRLSDETTFFIDDYDWVDAPGINGIVERLLRHTPPEIKFVIAARKQPDLPMAKLRMQNECRIVSIDNLRFSTSEALQFFNDVHQLHLPDGDVQVLIDKTEGWIAGLQLVMLAVRERESHSELIDSLSGEFRDVADYLADDVLKQQPKEIQDFLIKTSILNKLNAELCELLTQRPDSQSLLEKLESANLFLAPVDETRRWYRYHQLFREFLLSVLRKSEAIDSANLYRQASVWYEQKGMPLEAVQYALMAKDSRRASILVEKFAEQMIHHGQVRQVIAWIYRLPPEITKSRVRLSMIQVWALFHLGWVNQGRSILRKAKEQVAAGALGNYGESDYNRPRFDTECLTLETCLASVGEEADTVREMISRPKPMSAHYAFLSGTYANGLAAGSFSVGEFDRATAFAKQGYTLLSDADSSYGMIFATCLMGLVAMTRGQVAKAMYHFRRAENIAQADTDVSSYTRGLARLLQGTVHYLRFELEDADRLLTENLPLVMGCGYAEIWRTASMVHARIFALRRSWTRAEEVLKRGSNDQRQEWLNRTLPLVTDERVRNLINERDIESAERRALQFGLSLTEPLKAPDHWEREVCIPIRTQARLFLARGFPEPALACTESIRQLALKSERKIRYIELSVLESLIRTAMGDIKTANARLSEAIGEAADEGIVAPFIEEGSAIRVPLETFRMGVAEEQTLEFLKKIEAGFKLMRTDSGNVRGGRCGRQQQLTARELDVLALLAEGEENREIASQLSVSENTVKWHVRNILEKLCVENRMKAVLAAKDQGYI